MSRPDLIRDLRERIGQIERSQRLEREVGRLSTGLGALDQLLPGGGLERGTLIEWLSAGEASGAATLALAVTARVLEQGGVLVVIDERREFYPPAAAGLGIPLEHTVVVQPGTTRAALWALEQSLRSRAVAVVLGWIDCLHEHAFRRLQLAAETGGSLGFLLRPIACRAAPSWAEARLLVSALPLRDVEREARSAERQVLCPPRSALHAIQGRRLRVELLHCRGGVGGGAVELELSDEADPVRVAAQLADPARKKRAVRA